VSGPALGPTQFSIQWVPGAGAVCVVESGWGNVILPAVLEVPVVCFGRPDLPLAFRGFLQVGPLYDLKGTCMSAGPYYKYGLRWAPLVGGWGGVKLLFSKTKPWIEQNSPSR
jgi:hypothetical protein